MAQIHLTEGQLKGLKKKVQAREVAKELGVKESWVKKMEREIASLKKALKALDGQYEKMWPWFQEQQRKEGWDASEDNDGDRSV